MEKIISKLQEAVDIAHGLISEYKTKLALLVGREARLEQGEKEHEIRFKEINEREAAITPVENLKTLIRENDHKAAELSSKEAHIKEEAAKFQTYCHSRKTEFDNYALELKAIAEENEKAKRGIKEEVNRQVQDIIKNIKK